MNLLDLLFPKACVGCGKHGGYLCSTCLSHVSFSHTICPVCRRFNVRGVTHEKCKNDEALDGLISLWEYRGVIRKSIILLKYKFATDISLELATLSEVELRKFRVDSQAIYIPIPQEITRTRWRGFNHCDLLLKTIAEKGGLNVCRNLLYKVKKTAPQVRLSSYKRHTNIKGIYEVSQAVSKKIPKDKQIILFDDVWTTGSTIMEAAKTLKKQGFTNVWGFTISRS